jgi:broad specificity phosphatase PhoE
VPASISLIRHAEKQLGDGPPLGVLADGRPDPESLTPRGWERARALVGLFLPRADQLGAAILPTPTRLFASEVGPHSRSRRPAETLLPLSERLGLPLDEPFLQDEIDQIVEVIRACDGHVLVAWEHKRLPLIATKFVGDQSTVPQIWPDDRFDLVWVLESDPIGGGWRLRQVPQLLLAGDRAEPIA